MGRQNYLDSTEDRLVYSSDATPLLKQMPDAVVVPRSTEEISIILKFANDNGFCIVPRGSGTGLSGGAVPVENSIVLLMTSWDKILEIDSVNRCAWVEPGVITGVLQAEVEKTGLFYPPDPNSWQACAIGGNIAENAGGPRAFKYGVTREYVLGLDVVTSDGTPLFVGKHTVKGVTGYDVAALMVGSEGTLGVITGATLQLIPKPESVQTLMVFVRSDDDIERSVRQAVGHGVVPRCIELLDSETLRILQAESGLSVPNEARPAWPWRSTSGPTRRWSLMAHR